MTVKIGVLVPTSRMFPRVDRDFMDGLNSALRADGAAFELFIEPVGNCAVKDIVVERVQRLLLLNRPHLVTGIMGSGMAAHVHNMFRDYRVPFIVNNLGADPLRIGEPRHPFIFHNSLNLWQSAYALGFWAARNLGRKACVAASFHEAGYDMVRAFWRGFEQAGGGTVLRTEVTHRATSADDPTAQLGQLVAERPDFIAAFYSGREGISFMNAWHALGLQDAMPMVATPMLTHGTCLPHLTIPPIGIKTALSWSPESNPEEQLRFQRIADVEALEQPAVFKLLGYETGRLIANLGAATEASDALAGAAFTSPRGSLHLDANTGDVATVDYLLDVRQSAAGVRTATVGELELPADCQRHREDYKGEAIRSGWLNPYLVN